MAYKKLIKVSNVCQLLDKSKYPSTQTINGVAFTNNGDGTIIVNGTATSTAFFLLFSYSDSLIPGHKYLVFGSPNDASANAYIQCYDMTNGEWLRDIGGGSIAIFPKKVVRPDQNTFIRIRIANSYTANNLVFKPQFFDLTEMYGAGHEPTTVEQFRQDFPEEMYDYKPHCWATSYSRRLKVSNVCQLLKPNFLGNQTSAGITVTSNGNTFTLNGTSSEVTYISAPIYYITSKGIGHKFLISGCPQGAWSSYSIYFGAINQELAARDYGNGAIFTSTTAGNYVGFVIEKAGITLDNLVFKPQLFDLTEMYGAGNEPTTVEQFRQDFPDEIYDYKPYSIIPSYQRNLTCKTKNLFPYPYKETTLTKNGITFTDNGDGSITANGTATGNAPFYLFESSTSLMGLKAGSTYTISMEGSTASCYLVVNYYSDGSWHSGRFDSFHPEFLTKTIPSTWEGLQCYILVVPGATINNAVYKPMIELGSTATDYVPYGHL